MLATIIPPEENGDKNWAFHVIGIEPEGFKMIVAEMQNIKYAHSFLQGNSRRWAMVEFWTSDEDAILKAVDHLSTVLGVTYDIGDFMLEDIKRLTD